jgi:hypothetical protein
MSDTVVRPAVDDVLANGAVVAREMNIQQQSDRRFRLLPDGEARWSEDGAAWMQNCDWAVYVAEREMKLVGYIIARTQDSPPGLLARSKIGRCAEIAIGAHSGQSGLGRYLLMPLRQWFADWQITHLIALVPHRQPVEQAFWRAHEGCD